MINIISFLSKHRFLNVSLCVAFYLLVTLPHELVGVTIASIFKGVSLKTYDLTILSIVLLFLLGTGFFLFREIRNLEKPKIPIGFFVACLFLMIISLNFLIIVNIEMIHFIQYAVMAILLFPLCRNFLATLALVTLLGAIDEAYQYYYLSPERTNYYDFNDVILDLLGGAMGLIFLRSTRSIVNFLSTEIQKVHKRVWSYVTMCIAILAFLIWQKAGVQKVIESIGLSCDWENYGAILIRKPTTSFWTEIPPKIIYHVVQPLEGVIIIVLLLAIFSFLYIKVE